MMVSHCLPKLHEAEPVRPWEILARNIRTTNTYWLQTWNAQTWDMQIEP